MSDHALALMALADELEAFIHTVVPQATTVKKYGGMLFTVKPEEKEGQFCGVFIYKQHVQLAFSMGVDLDDPHQCLKGSGKYQRHINVASRDALDFDVLRPLLQQAAAQ